MTETEIQKYCESENEIQKYYEFYTLTWKLLRRALNGMTTTSDPVRFANDIRSEATVIYEKYKDLGREPILTILTQTLQLFYSAYENLPRPDREPEQMDIFALEKVAT